MRMTRAAGIIGLLLALPIPRAGAQEQTLIVSESLKTCSPIPSPSTPSTLEEEHAARLIKDALGSEPEADRYYMVHAVKYSTGLTVESQEWYVYYKAWTGTPGLWGRIRDPRIKKHFQESRIYGSPHTAMVYLHQNVSTVDTTAAVARSAAFFLAQDRRLYETDPAAFERAFESVEQRLPKETIDRARDAAAPDVRDEENNVVPYPLEVRQMAQLRAEEYVRAVRLGDSERSSQLTLVDRDTGRPVVPLSDTLLTTSAYGPLASLTYRIAVTKKIPAPLQNLKAVGEQIFGHAAAATVAVEVRKGQAVCAGQELHIGHLPSDMVVTALTGQGKEEKELGKQTFDNERKYWFDVSFALPLKSHTDLSLDSSGGEITAKKVEKTDLFAVLNLSPWEYDTKKPQAHLLPIFMYGMPITDNPLEHHLAGVGFGLNLLQVFVGVRFDRNEVVSTSQENGVTTGTVAPPAAGKKWDRQFVWGINLPVRTVVNLLKPKK